MPQRSPRVDIRVPVRVLPKARTLIHRAAFDLLADMTLRLASNPEFDMSRDIAAMLQVKGHVAILDGAGAAGSTASGGVRAATHPYVEPPAYTPRREAAAALPEWRRGALERLRNRVERDEQTGCLVWKGAMGRGGYGTISYKGISCFTHRLSWLAHRGPIPNGLFVCHSCDNRCCIEISHLFLGTAQDNVTDMIRKGRARLFGRARLTEADVAEIKRRLADGQPASAIAKLKSVSYGSVVDIKLNRRWRHVEAAPRGDDCSAASPGESPSA